MSNLPLGADKDPKAPYNEPDIKPVEVDINVCHTLYKDTTIKTTDYEPIKLTEADVDADDIDRVGLIEPNFEETQWETAYINDNTEFTIPELLYEFQKRAKIKVDKYKRDIARLKPKDNLFKSLAYWEKVYRSCEGWHEEELVVTKND